MAFEGMMMPMAMGGGAVGAPSLGPLQQLLQNLRLGLGNNPNIMRAMQGGLLGGGMNAMGQLGGQNPRAGGFSPEMLQMLMMMLQQRGGPQGLAGATQGRGIGAGLPGPGGLGGLGGLRGLGGLGG